MKFYIWGAGYRGKRILDFIVQDDVIAFVEKDVNKIGMTYCGKKIMSVEEYIREGREFPIIISFMDETEGIRTLEAEGIKHYLLWSQCPSEMCDKYSDIDIFSHIKTKYIDSDKTYGVFGYTVFGILLYQLLSNVCKKAPHMILDNNMYPIEVFEFLQRNGINVEAYANKIENKFDQIFLCKSISKNYISKIQNTNYCYAYDFSSEIADYYNSRLLKFRNRHLGKRCFIVATGPSLQMSDLEKLHKNNEICISMNGIYNCFSEVKWRPQYYVVSEPRIIEQECDIIRELTLENLFIRDGKFQLWEKEVPSNIYKFHSHYEMEYQREPSISDDFAQKCYGVGTVTYICLQLAIYMGIKEIYLLGVDFSSWKNQGDEYKHFYEGNKYVVPPISEFFSLEAYKVAKRYAEEHHIKICNATRGGRLEVFERVNFDDLFIE